MSNTFKPILFSTPMVQAILNGTKTQTRRLLSPQPYKEEDWHADTNEGRIKLATFIRHPKKGKYDGVFLFDAPKLWPAKYKVGDILWVRETFGKLVTDDSFCYAADVENPKYDKPYFGWKPSIHMPKEAARIFLYVTNVRCERLQDITEADAIAEGIESFNHGYGGSPRGIWYKNYHYDTMDSPPVRSFKTLWQKINGLESWEQNPYVWVYDFEQIEKPLDFLNHE